MKTKKNKVKPFKVVRSCVLEWAKTYEGPKFHAMLCDPPYAIGFMGKKWDASNNIVNDPNTWKSLAEHLHPGAFCFAFSSTRTLHRMMVAIEDAGMIIHPIMLAWNFANGMPKATQPAYQIDAILGKKPKTNYVSSEGVNDNRKYNKGLGGGIGGIRGNKFEAASSDGQSWQGHRYGLQALKPAFEPIICFQKPYPKKQKPVLSMLDTGAGALNIDLGRIGYEAGGSLASNPSLRKSINGGNGGHVISSEKERRVVIPNNSGRWPSNVILQHLPECRCLGTHKIKPKGGLSSKHAGGDYTNKDGKWLAKFKGATRASKDENGEENVTKWECVKGCPVNELDQQSGIRPVAKSSSDARNSVSILRPGQGAYQKQGKLHQDQGTASRYYFQAGWDYEVMERLADCVPVKYVPKPSNKEKSAGLESRNPHPTLKPLALAEYLAKLLLPPKKYRRRLLVPFAGSGSEVIGGILAGWDRIVGIEREQEYVPIARARIKHWRTRKLDKRHPEGIVATETKQTKKKKKKASR